MAKLIGAKVYNNADISLANATWVYLTFNSEEYDDEDIHSTVANTSRLTCVTAGRYLIIGQVYFDTHAAGRRLIKIRLNGVTDIANTEPMISTSVDYTRDDIATIINLDVGDYVELGAYQNRGGALDVLYIGDNAPYFMMQRNG